MDKATFSEQDLFQELEDLRGDLLHTITVATPCLGLLWLAYVIWAAEPPGLAVIATTMLLVASIAANALRQWRFVVSGGLLVVALGAASLMLMGVYPGPTTAVVGVLVIIVAHGLLGFGGGALAVVALWGSATGLARMGATLLPPTASGYGMLAAYALVLGVVWLTSRPLRRSIALALAGWSQVSDALQEVRERRAELYRVVRALEEATYRIERTNNELVLAQQEAEEARALKTRFVAAVSHELRSPLNLILGFATLMVLSPETYGEPLPPAYRRDIHTIYQNCQHLLALVNDILDLAQIEARRLPLVKDRIDLLDDVIAKAVHSVQPLAERKGLGVMVKAERELPWLLADPVRLRQAVLNLLTNSVRVTEHGGITVRVAVEGESVVVSVEDTGPGIREADQAKLFREFSELSQADDQKTSGLGLAITKHLIELHGGRIWVESQEGVGTRFSFSVPLPGVEARSGELLRSDAIERAPTMEPSCLVVHQDRDVLRLLARHIAGYHTVGVADPENLLALVRDLHPRGIITTSDAARDILAQVATTPYDVPVISCDMPRVTDRHDLSNVLGYLVKPIAPETLTALMGQIEIDGELSVLLVDDEPDAVRLLEQLLMRLPHPYHVLKAYDGEQALRVMQDVAPHIVFLDMVMPGINGMQVLESMRRDSRLRDIPAVVVSGRDWIDENATLGNSLCLERRQPLTLEQGIACMQGLLDALSSDYVTVLSGPTPSAEASPAQ